MLGRRWDGFVVYCGGMGFWCMLWCDVLCCVVLVVLVVLFVRCSLELMPPNG